MENNLGSAPKTTNVPVPVGTAKDTADGSIARLTDLLSEKMERALPRPEPFTFKGDLLDYAKWITSFESLVEQKTTDTAQRLYYLDLYTSGRANAAISGLLNVRTTESYNKAKKVLAHRFGNPYSIGEAYVKKIENWPRILPNDGPRMREFTDFLVSCKTAMDSIQYLQVLNSPAEIKKMYQKLPIYIIHRWSRVVQRWTTMNEEERDSNKIPASTSNSAELTYPPPQPTYPPFSEFCKFIEKEAENACTSVEAGLAESVDQPKKPPLKERKQGLPRNKGNTIRSFATKTSEVQAQQERPKKEYKGQNCILCKAPHDLDDCEAFLSKSLAERKDFVWKNWLCLGCFKPGHISRACRNRKTCRLCNLRHPTSLHDNDYMSSQSADRKFEGRYEVTTHRVKFGKTATTQTHHTQILPVWIHHSKDPKYKVLVYALLDDQSDGCFITDATLERLRLEGLNVQLEISTVLRTETINSKKVDGLVAKGFFENIEIPLPHTYTRRGIPVKHDQIPTSETARRWPHLERIADKLMPYNRDLEVGLLIGVNCIQAIKPVEVIPGSTFDPYGSRTALGWGIIGKIQRSMEPTEDHEGASYNNTVTQEVKIGQESKMCHFALRTQVKEVFSPCQVNKMLELDFSEREVSGHSPSHEDRKFTEMMTKSIHQLQDRHYEMPLPFKNVGIHLPDNRNLAVSRIKKLRGRLGNNTRYRQDYTEFMKTVIEKGYAEVVPTDEGPPKDGHVWYIPHHGVYHAKKPDKLRVVFDCSAGYQNQSLNQLLLQGPDLTNNLTGVLCRFRQEPVALVCDIEGMFHQVKVNVEHRNFLRFLWWKDSNLEEELVDYRMTVHLFGATSSPSVANFALKTTANDYERKWGKEAADFVRDEFYVDDGLKSVPTVAEAIDLMHKAKSLCEEGGFKLHKFMSNSKRVLEAIQPEERASSVKSLDLANDTLPIERTLGIQWCVELDAFQFRIQLSDRPLTRRGILSTVSSVFDPLGMVSPFVLLGKRILQDLCRDGMDWDKMVPDAIRKQWERWRSELHALGDLKVPRCYKPEEFGNAQSVELHPFSDASQDGYGQCSYLRFTNNQDKFHSALVMAKARVTPLKPTTIPRLELTAAVVSVRVSAMLQRELRYLDIKHFFWTDSKVVLGYINNDTRRFHVFVANRTQQIRDLTSPEQWRYIDTKCNPADYASRGLHARDLIDSTRWWNGPEILQRALDDQSSQGFEDISEDDPEVKKFVVHTTRTDVFPSFLCRLEYFSDWHRAKRATAICLRLQQSFKGRSRDATKEIVQNGGSAGKPLMKKMPSYPPVTVGELQAAESEILRQVQSETFSQEMKIVNSLKLPHRTADRDDARKRNNAMRRTGSLYRLDPFVDEEGILRVGGRIKRMDMSVKNKHPAILPRKGHITNLIVCHHHGIAQHQGRGITLNEIRSSGFWIIGGPSVVTRHISNCVKCRKLRGALQEQKMADLPDDRLNPAPPFTYCAVDYFGPWYVRKGRSEVKRYGVLFTCMASRAIHLEIAHSLDTDSFINAYRRFVGRRGPIRQLRSDQGTNFVGAKNELESALQEMDDGKVRRELLKENCDWIDFKMNVPNASHMGGVWERQIRTVRSIMSSLLDHHGAQLDDESLQTFMVEAEAIANSRPLTVDSLNSPHCPEPLTPNHLLTMKSKVVLPPPGIFQQTDQYCRKRWRRVQYLANEFWNRWRREYIQSLQLRQKWVKRKRNVQLMILLLSRTRMYLATIETSLGNRGCP